MIYLSPQISFGQSTISSPEQKTVSNEGRLEKHPIHHFGFPKPGSAHGLAPEFVMARTLQRNPNATVRKNLDQLHFNMVKKFGDMSNESIDWLLGGSRQTCRGGFSTVSEFKEFLAKNSGDIPTARLISQLETILSAIAYRVIRDPRQEQPCIAATTAQKEMFDVIFEMTNGQLVRSINRVYSERVSDRINDDLKSDEMNTTSCVQLDELSDDEDDSFRGQPKKRISPAQFKMISDSNQLSWIYRAQQHGVYVRNHVSGTTPVALAATAGLLHETIWDNEEEARELFTALFMPKYLRSDYHSLAEIQAGIDHFMSEHRHNKDNSNPVSQVIDPEIAEQRAYSSMCFATCGEENSQYGISPRKAMEDYCAILEKKRNRPLEMKWTNLFEQQF